jgi:hypothetical protein
MALSLCSPSTSQYLSFPSYVVSFSTEEWKLRALQSSCHTQFELLHLGISLTISPVDIQRWRTRIRSSGIATAHKCWTEKSAFRSRFPCSRISSEKHALSVNSALCNACGETSGASNGASSSRVSRMENGAACVVTSAYGRNGIMVEKKVAIVWFKHDLRMDDHPGLASAAQYDYVLPLFIFDSSFYAGMLPGKISLWCHNLGRESVLTCTSVTLARGYANSGVASLLGGCLPRRIAFC